MSSPAIRLLTALPALLLLLALSGATVHAEEDGEPTDRARRAAIKQLGKDLRKRARSPRAPRYKDEILKMLESLEVLGGAEAAEAALGGVALEDEEVRDRIFALVDKEHHEDLVKPLVALLEHRDYRRDFDLKQRIARSLSIMASTDAVEPLADLIRSDEDAHVVQAAADSLASYATAPLALRKEAVKRLVDVYTSTYNLMMSIRPEDRVIASKMKERYRIFARSLRSALQSLTGQQITRPQEWRKWWNENKKRNDW